MTPEKAEARYQEQLEHYRRKVENARRAVTQAEESLATYEREKDSYITWYRSLP